MCESFLSYVRGTDNLTYENTPIAVLTNHKKQVAVIQIPFKYLI